ncbi:transmembrane protein [Citrus sinensis]|nr:transmembrane protein [Citrus sinensis]
MTAIGPFTYELRSRDHLKGMEEYKKRFLKKLLERQLLERRGEQLARTLVSVMRKLEGEARKCYSEKVSLTSHQFVEMMLLDACFIVELFCYRALGIGYARPNIVQVENEFIRIRCATELQEAGIKFEKIPKTTTDELPELPILFEEVIIQTAPPNTEQVKNEEFIRIRCATELQEAGIKFEKIPKTTMDELPELPILFEEAKGIMKISELTIDNGTESLLRNLTDYEQYQNTRYGPLVSYIDVMDGLINTVKDVKILCESGILTNCLGDEEVVAQMFNRLGVCVRLPPENNYKEMLKNVNKYCDRKWNKWMANLWHNYFNTPWAIISFFAALVLLILAAVQTVFSVLAYFKSSCLGEGLVLLISSVFMNVGQYCRVLH